MADLVLPSALDRWHPDCWPSHPAGFQPCPPRPGTCLLAKVPEAAAHRLASFSRPCPCAMFEGCLLLLAGLLLLSCHRGVRLSTPTPWRPTVLGVCHLWMSLWVQQGCPHRFPGPIPLPRGERVVPSKRAPSRLSWAVGFRGKAGRTEEEEGKIGRC